MTNNWYGKAFNGPCVDTCEGRKTCKHDCEKYREWKSKIEKHKEELRKENLPLQESMNFRMNTIDRRKKNQLRSKPREKES